MSDEEELTKSLSVQPEDRTISDEGKLEETKPSVHSTRASAEKAAEVDAPRAPPTSTKKKKKVRDITRRMWYALISTGKDGKTGRAAAVRTPLRQATRSDTFPFSFFRMIIYLD